MNANDVIQAYVTDVAVLLPRRQRNDVAFELRALLQEELQGKAADAGRAADAPMAVEFLNGFGLPAEVAARYQPALAVIDPADGPAFVRAAGIGLVVIWLLGALQQLAGPLDSGDAALRAFASWWTGTVVASLWWPGALVVGYATAAWARRRWPQASTWTPRAHDRLRGGRSAVALGVVGILCGVSILLYPPRVLDLFLDAPPPAAIAALTYTDAFVRGPAPWLFAALLLYVPLLIAAIVHGRWTPRLRIAATAIDLLGCAAMAWSVLAGPVFVAAPADRIMRPVMVLSIALTLATLAVQWGRRVKPEIRS